MNDIKMLYFDRFDVSEEIDVKKSVILVTIGIF